MRLLLQKPSIANITLKNKATVDNVASNRVPQDINITGGGTIVKIICHLLSAS